MKAETKTFYHKNGQKRKETEYRDGTKHGKWKTWHQNGQKRMEGEHRDGKEHGKRTWWHENGQKYQEGEYRDGKKHGNLTIWHENGQKSFEGEWRDGSRHGKRTDWYENGQVEGMCFYINGERHNLLNCECKNEVTLYVKDFVFINNQIYHLFAACDEGEGLLWARHVNSTERALISNKADAMVFRNEKQI